MPVGKVRSASYWELIGPDLIPREGDSVGWTEEKIRGIDGILEIGMTTYDDEAISQRCKCI